jgi:hypothetical protein
MADLAMFEPDVMGGAMKAAEQLARSSLIPRALHGKPGDVLVVLLTGREFGLGPMQALRSIHVMDGKPVMAADLMVGLCVARREVCEHFTLAESTGKRATYKTKRVGGAEVSLTWTIEQATAAGLTARDNWRKYPDAMLRARCSAALARAVYPDLLAGTYDPDELDAQAASESAATGRRAPRVVESQAMDAPLALPESTGPAVATQGEVRAPVEASGRDVRPADVPTFEKPAPGGPEDVVAAIIEEARQAQTEDDLKALGVRARTLPDGPLRKKAGAALMAAGRRLGLPGKVAAKPEPGSEG